MVSIATDQVQGMAAMLMAIVISIYVAVTFRQPILDPLPSFAAGDAFNLVSPTALAPVGIVTLCPD